MTEINNTKLWKHFPNHVQLLHFKNLNLEMKFLNILRGNEYI